MDCTNTELIGTICSAGAGGLIINSDDDVPPAPATLASPSSLSMQCHQPLSSSTCVSQTNTDTDNTDSNYNMYHCHHDDGTSLRMIHRAFINEVKAIAQNEKSKNHYTNENKKQNHYSFSHNGSSNNNNNNSSSSSSSSSSYVYYSKSTCAFRIMGRVRTIQFVKSNSFQQKGQDQMELQQQQQQQQKDYAIIRLDDGTECINLIVHESKMNRVDGKIVQIGDCIDCVGHIVLVLIHENHKDNKRNKINPTNNNEKDIISKNHDAAGRGDDNGNGDDDYLYVQSFSIISDPNIETLRMLELSSWSTTHTSTTASRFEYYMHNDLEKNSILIFEE